MEKKQEKELGKINLRMHQVRALKELRLPSGILNTEALMLILNKKYKTPDGSRMLFKYLDAQEEVEVMERKTRTLTALNNSSYAELEELIIPSHSVNVDGAHAGFAMPLIEKHKNLGKILNDERISFEAKKRLLIKLGDLIDKVRRVKSDKPMYFGDLNEFNFIIDQEGKLKAIDLDSVFVSGLEGVEPSRLAYYLLKNEYISSIPDKYKTTSNGIIIPSENSDLYCYNMIILDALSNERMFKVDMNTYYQYLMFLASQGIPRELIESFERIYLPKQNINPRNMIEAVPKRLGKKCDFQTFKEKYKIK